MTKDILKFIECQRVGVLAVQMPDGSPHAATLHFAFSQNPPTFIFITSPTSRKTKPMHQGDVRASLVIGMDEANQKTLQMDGIAKLIDTEKIRSAYFSKFPEAQDEDLKDIFFIFTPTWWRFTDWTTPEGKKIWSSE